MSRKVLKLLLMTLTSVYTTKCFKKQNFSFLIDFTCSTAKDELEKHPEMRTIAMIELENNFPPDFSQKMMKCLPEDVSKVIINPHDHFSDNSSFTLPKKSLIIYVADKVELTEIFTHRFNLKKTNFPVVHHLSKHLIVSSDKTIIQKTQKISKKLVQIYVENQKMIARSFDMTRNLTTFETFESSQRENLSQILFPDKTKSLNGQLLDVKYVHTPDAHPYRRGNISRVNSKWTPFLDIIIDKLNVTLNFTQIPQSLTKKLINESKLDFHLNIYSKLKYGLECHSTIDWCFMVPLPEPYSITELILFMPMDKSCWMWLGITIAASTFIWRISEGHWNFAFGAFSHFMGQTQASINIRTNRLTMKILLQLLIFAIFIFSNGYQSLVTSFMLNPVQHKLLKSFDEVLESDLKLSRVDILKTSVYRQKTNPRLLRAEREGRIINHSYVDTERWTEEAREIHLADLSQCELSKRRIEREGDGKTYKGMYLIPEVVLTLGNNLFVPSFHPYTDKFQELMDRSFEAGLHQKWIEIYWEIYYEKWKNLLNTRKAKENKKETLDFGLISPFFLILVFGFFAAVLAFLWEIFWKDFVSELTRDYFERKWNETFVREIEIEIEN